MNMMEQQNQPIEFQNHWKQNMNFNYRFIEIKGTQQVTAKQNGNLNRNVVINIFIKLNKKLMFKSHKSKG